MKKVVNKRVIGFLRRIGRKGGRSKTETKIKSCLENLAKARQARWGRHELKRSGEVGAPSVGPATESQSVEPGANGVSGPAVSSSGGPTDSGIISHS